MVLNQSQKKLFELVKKWHYGQERKYTGDPYYTHPYSVAEIVSKYCREFGAIEVALLHDVLEDTIYDEAHMYGGLLSCDYSPVEATLIINHVNDLTDEYTKQNYPELNREQRKNLESERLGFCDYLTQSVKYADLIDNTSSIVDKDRGFAKIYLKEKRQMLERMVSGNIILYKACMKSLQESENKLLQEA